MEDDFLVILLNNPDLIYIFSYITPVEWQDGFSGDEQIYYPSFSVMHTNGCEEHIEVTYPRMPLTKYLYAQNNLIGWRMISDNELRQLSIEPNEKIRWW